MGTRHADQMSSLNWQDHLSSISMDTWKFDQQSVGWPRSSVCCRAFIIIYIIDIYIYLLLFYIFRSFVLWQNYNYLVYFINTFKYHVSCTDGKISVGIIYFYYLFFQRRRIQGCVLFAVGLSSLMRHFQPERPTGKKKQLLSGMTVEK